LSYKVVYLNENYNFHATFVSTSKEHVRHARVFLKSVKHVFIFIEHT
jgi:hypothetical protein